MAILINPGRSRKKIDISAVFRRAGVKANPRKRKSVKAKRFSMARNPRKNRSRKRSYRMNRKNHKNPLLVNRKRRSYRKNRKNHKNPLLVNRKRRSYRKNHKNPLLVNRKRRSSRRSYRMNPASDGSLTSKLTRPVAGILAKVPLLGKGILAPAVILAGGAITGGVSTYLLHTAMGYVDEYVPNEVKAVGYTLTSSLLAVLVLKLPKFPGQRELAVALPAAGGAIDAWRYLKGASDELGELAGWGAADMPETGGAGTSYEYQDANLLDHELCSDDLDDEECQMAALGRRAWWDRYKYPRAHVQPQGKSYHAGRPGGRFGWLIYIIGFDNFRDFSKLPSAQRHEWMKKFRFRAHEIAQMLLQGGQPTDVSTAANAGLLNDFTR